MIFRRRLGIFLIICVYAGFFVWSITDMRRISSEMHENFLKEEYSGEVSAVERRNRGNQICLVNGDLAIFAIDFSYRAMQKYRNKRFSDFVLVGDSIFKEKGSEIVVIKKKDGGEFKLICK